MIYSAKMNDHTVRSATVSERRDVHSSGSTTVSERRDVHSSGSATVSERRDVHSKLEKKITRLEKELNELMAIYQELNSPDFTYEGMERREVFCNLDSLGAHITNNLDDNRRKLENLKIIHSVIQPKYVESFLDSFRDFKYLDKPTEVKVLRDLQCEILKIEEQKLSQSSKKFLIEMRVRRKLVFGV